MRHITRRRNSVMAASAILAFAVAQAAFIPAMRAANLTWDSTGTTPAAPVDGTGTWDTTPGTATNWSSIAADAAWNNANLDTAYFGNGGVGGTVTLNGATSVGGLVFNAVSSPYTIAGNALSIGASGITVNSGAGAPTISSAVALTAAQSWTNNSTGLFTVSGAITNNTAGLTINGSGSTLLSTALGATNTGSLTVGGTGTLILNQAETYTGATTINTGATLQLGFNNNAGSLTNSASITNNGTFQVARTGGGTMSAACLGTQTSHEHKTLLCLFPWASQPYKKHLAFDSGSSFVTIKKNFNHAP